MSQLTNTSSAGLLGSFAVIFGALVCQFEPMTAFVLALVASAVLLFCNR